LTNKQIEGNFR